MRHCELVLTLLLTSHLIAPNALAQTDETGERQWMLRVFYSLPDNAAEFNSRGLVHFLEENDFGPRTTIFGYEIDYPVVDTEDAAWSLLAAYSIRPQLRVGGLFYRAQDVEAAGYYAGESSIDLSRNITLQQTMWALAPIALWKPASFVDLGVGPAFIQGGTAPLDAAPEQRVEAQEASFQRLGAVVLVSLGFTILNRRLNLGLQGQFLYGGKVEVGPYHTEANSLFPEEITLNVQKTRIDQLTWGPMIGLNL